jgi:hypothetical protein
MSEGSWASCNRGRKSSASGDPGWCTRTGLLLHANRAVTEVATFGHGDVPRLLVDCAWFEGNWRGAGRWQEGDGADGRGGGRQLGLREVRPAAWRL